MFSTSKLLKRKSTKNQQIKINNNNGQLQVCSPISLENRNGNPLKQTISCAPKGSQKNFIYPTTFLKTPKDLEKSEHFYPNICTKK